MLLHLIFDVKPTFRLFHANNKNKGGKRFMHYMAEKDGSMLSWYKIGLVFGCDRISC